MATLRVYRGDQFVAPFELGEGRTRIGRGTDNHLVLEDHDKQVSRSHAEIWHERGRYVIADLNSQNGVWIGERQIKTEEPLPVNVPVTIGPYRLILMPEEKPSTASTDELDGAAVTGRREAYVEPTQLLEPAAKVPPASQQSHPPKPAPAKPSQAAQPGRTQSGKSPAPEAKPRSNTVPIIAAIAALLVLGVVGIMVLRNRNGAPKVDQTPPPAAGGTTSSVTTTSVPAPPAPPPEFQDHVSKADTFIAAGDKTSAAAENAAALALVADDAGALAQRDRIQQMPDPPPTGQPGVPGPNKPPVPTGPETLRVLAKPGESEKERAGREKTAKTQLDDGKRALNERQYDAAITALNLAIQTSNRPDFGNVPGEAAGLLKQARTSKNQAEANAKRAEAVTALEEARSLVGSDPVACKHETAAGAESRP